MSQARRKRPDETTHEYHHSLIDERKAAWLAVPRRQKIKRREAWKNVWWTLTGHLRSQHGYRKSFFQMTYQQVEDLHTQLHEED